MLVTFSPNGKPTDFPVSVASVLSWLRAPSEDEALVKRLISRAFGSFVKYTNGHVAALSTYDIWVDRDQLEKYNITRLPVAPLYSAFDTIIAFDDQDNEYELNVRSLVGDDRFVLLSDIDKAIRKHRTAKITATFGYSNDDMPDDIIAGAEAFITYLYEHRGDTDGSIPENVQLLWSPYVRYQL